MTKAESVKLHSEVISQLEQGDLANALLGLGLLAQCAQHEQLTPATTSKRGDLRRAIRAANVRAARNVNSRWRPY